MTDKPKTLGQIAHDAWHGEYDPDRMLFSFSEKTPEAQECWGKVAQAVSAHVESAAFREGAEWMKERAADQHLSFVCDLMFTVGALLESMPFAEQKDAEAIIHAIRDQGKATNNAIRSLPLEPEEV